MALVTLLVLIVSTTAVAEDAFIGVNIGTQVANMPNPRKVAALLTARQIRHVRLYNADRAMLLALANTGIRVAVSVPNDHLLAIAQSNSTASNWVSQNVLAYYPATNITIICVGSEVLTSLPDLAPGLINALNHIHSALMVFNLDKKIKVSTPISSSIVLNSFPSPSRAFFNQSWTPVLIPMLKFLQSAGSSFMINIYPYMAYMRNITPFPLDYLLFKPLPANKHIVDVKTHLRYSNAFDTMVDAVYFAMANLNVTDVPVMVTESGWPSKGDAGDTDIANPGNAETYNANLVRHVLNKTGTPKNPGIAISTYIYELYNEDMKPGPMSGEHWGLFDTNGVPTYMFDLTSSGGLLSGNHSTNQTHCIAKANADTKMVQAALDWACGNGKVDCTPLLEGHECYEPDTLSAHATYAFDVYYHQMGKAPGSCDFDGVATVTSTSLGNGSCTFSERDGKNVSLLNNTVPETDLDSPFSAATLHCRNAFPTEYIVAVIVVVWTALLV